MVVVVVVVVAVVLVAVRFVAFDCQWPQTPQPSSSHDSMFVAMLHIYDSPCYESYFTLPFIYM